MPQFLTSELATWSGGSWEGPVPAVIDGVCSDSRKIQKGNLYFALKGPNFDGHAFVADVATKGCPAAVVARDWAGVRPGDSALLRVSDPAAALRDIATGYRRKVNPAVIAVTGSVGKSTVKEMITQILAHSFETAGTKGNWNNEIGLPLSLLAMSEKTQKGVFEVGMNHPGEISALCRILKPSWGVVTNVGPVHIEAFGSIEGVANEKADLLRSLPDDGLSVVNMDTDCFDILKKAAPGELVTVSMRRNSDYLCASWNAARGEAVVLESGTGERYPFKTRLRGDHNILNALLAVAVARKCGMKWETIAQALMNFVQLPMRWEEKELGGIRIINDAYNANPLSMRAAIKAFEEEKVKGRKWLVLAGMLELGAESDQAHFDLGGIVGKSAGFRLVAIGKSGKLISQGAVASGQRKEDIFECDCNADAVELLSGRLAGGDAVLFKASRGMKLEEVVNGLVKKTGG